MQRLVYIAIGTVVAIIVVVTVIWSFSGGEPEPEPAPPAPPPPVEVEPVVTEPEREPIVLPPLVDSDDMVRGMIETLSAHPRLADALATQGVIDTFVTAVVAIANGEIPRGVVDYLEPEEGFAIAEREGRVVIDPASFERYTWSTGVFASLDPNRTAEVYRQLEPLFDEAYRNLGYPDGKFRVALDTAMNRLASTPVPDGYIEVQRGAVFWQFRDASLEALSPGQKHLLRMGPANARMVQSQLREIQAALGR